MQIERTGRAALREAGAAVGARRQVVDGGVGRVVDRRHLGEAIPELADVQLAEQPVRPDPLPLAVVHPAGRELGQRRLLRPEGRQTAQRQRLVVVLVVADDRVLRGRLPGRLAGKGPQDAEVRRHVRVDARQALIDVELVVGHVEPQLVPLERAAEIVVILPELEVLGVRPAQLGDVRVDVAADEALRLVGLVDERLELVAAALDREDSGRSGRVHRHVLARRRHRDLIGGVVVPVAARAAGPFGRIRPLDDDAVLVALAEGGVAVLLVLVAAADVEARHADAGGLRQRAPDVGRGRHADELRRVQRVAEPGRLRVDDRRRRGHGDVLLERRQLQLPVDGQRLPEREADVGLTVGLEAGEIELQRVAAWRQ